VGSAILSANEHGVSGNGAMMPRSFMRGAPAPIFGGFFEKE
jgi:hypothetical protein